jgi:hypothetical protein
MLIKETVFGSWCAIFDKEFGLKFLDVKKTAFLLAQLDLMNSEKLSNFFLDF